MSSRASTRSLMAKSQNTKSVLGLKKVPNENLNRPPLSRKPSTTNLLRDTTNKVLGLKRKAETSNDENKVTKKRSAFGDLTNAFDKNKEAKKPLAQKERVLRNVTNNVLKAKTSKPVSRAPSFGKTKPKTATREEKAETSKSEEVKDISFCESLLSSQEPVLSSQESTKTDADANKTDLDDSAAYITASEGRYSTKRAPKRHRALECGSPPVPLKLQVELQVRQQPQLPEGVDDYDREMENDLYAVATYAQDIFKYYKEREGKFTISKYIDTQPEVSKSMRSILVDWMVEVQESFELNHETLYLAVKIVDLYLSRYIIKRDQLQLLGSTALFIACKFDERTPPYADDFLYICDDAYKRKELLSMEIKVLKVVGYDLGIPLSYRFLRRYARCAKVSMEDLTLTRFILEMSLMDYDLIDASDSALAAAALFFTRIIRGDPTWSPTLQYYSGYSMEDLYHLVHHLHNMILQPPKDHLKTIRNKYSHKVFFEVALIPIPENLNI
ncbi:G2/mitotic-specific cyclin-B3-like isoform X1 [Macrobrachium nipponense]|uniref:Cyclin B3 n=1 Tax=Macrobrachium nipponense TaxID=159736 RepID=A0A9E8D070_MACNP|nr:cyclin B3 [Macrobrachium nipponense]